MTKILIAQEEFVSMYLTVFFVGVGAVVIGLLAALAYRRRKTSMKFRDKMSSLEQDLIKARIEAEKKKAQQDKSRANLE